jgi:hypothetical protein
MRMSEIMSAMDLSIWPKAALVIFIGVFVMIAWRTLREPRKNVDHYASLPIDDEPRAR